MTKELFLFAILPIIALLVEPAVFCNEIDSSLSLNALATQQTDLSERQQYQFVDMLQKLSHLKRIAEIGVGPELFLEHCPDAEVVSFNQSLNEETQLAVKRLSQTFPNRFRLIEDDLEDPLLPSKDEKFDLIVVNGKDISSISSRLFLNLRKWANQNTLLWIYDDHSGNAMQAVQFCEKEGLVKVIKSPMLSDKCSAQGWIEARYEIHTESKQAFSEVYRLGIWGKNSEGEGTSGNGSTLSGGLPFINYVQDFLESHDISSILDIGCGDWVLGKEIHWGERIYTGIDVVPDLIIKNRESFATSRVRFLNLDILSDPMPEADLLICKDVLMHLPISDIFKMLDKLKKYKYCIIVNDFFPLWNAQNSEIRIGEYRPLGLTSYPFNLKPNASTIYDAGGYFKQLLLIQNEF
ncbi:MAG: class I SAM-dependent methyltransferase [Parachlamydiales bacterium]|nr:class I SAM-dependent methyltransferase [Verrucomicrobiota bacterium]MBX3718034.1 class I SAM-dependent methyltransferase [Candidatus Acheromyda pituitae]